MKKAIVIGCYTAGLGIIRSLGIEGFEIIALPYKRMDYAQTSRYVRESVKVPHPGTEQKEFVEFLIRNSDRWKDAFLLETNDEASVAISKNKDKLEKHYKMATPDWPILRKFIEKSETYRLAEKCDVPYPKTFILKKMDELHEIEAEILYPCLLKPVVGHEFASRFRSKNFVVNNHHELSSKFEISSQSGHEVMVQEIIPGPDTNFYSCALYINTEGDVSTRFFRRKLRQNPPHFGVGRVAISKERIPIIENFAERILRQADFRGFASAEFKKDSRDNQFKLIEINVRMLRTIWHPTYCGVNFPLIAYMDLVENNRIKVADYKKDAYWIELYDDLSYFALHRNTENLGFRDYVRPYLSKNKTFADLSMEDPIPFLKRLSHWPLRRNRYSRWRKNKQ